MLENSPLNNKNDKKKIIIMYAVIAGICLLSLILVMVMHIMELSTPKVTIKEENSNINIADFDTLFDNKINTQNYTIKETEKKEENKELVYTSYTNTDKKEGNYDFTVNIPAINLKSENIGEINSEINSIFKKKVNNIVKSDEVKMTVYTVNYTAYLNSNILSLVIKSTLKEENTPQRVIVKGYTYNLSTGEEIDLKDLMLIKQINNNDIEKEIKKVINNKNSENQKLIELGYNVFKRDTNSEIYKTENIDNFFYGPEGVIYIIYAYGNSEFTSEVDIVPVK